MMAYSSSPSPIRTSFFSSPTRGSENSHFAQAGYYTKRNGYKRFSERYSSGSSPYASSSSYDSLSNKSRNSGITSPSESIQVDIDLSNEFGKKGKRDLRWSKNKDIHRQNVRSENTLTLKGSKQGYKRTNTHQQEAQAAASPGSSSGRRLLWSKFTPSKKTAEDYQEQIDSLMGLVISLQDQGKLDEVGPVLKKIQRLQEKSERALEEQFRKSGREYTVTIPAESQGEELEPEEDGMDIELEGKSQSLAEPPEETQDNQPSKRVTFSPDVDKECSSNISSVETINTHIESYMKTVDIDQFDLRSGQELDLDDEEQVVDSGNEQPDLTPEVEIVHELETSNKRHNPKSKEKTKQDREIEEEARAAVQAELERERIDEEKRVKEEERRRKEEEKHKKEMERMQRRLEKRRRKEIERSLAAMGIDNLMLDPPPEEKRALRSFKDIQRIAKTKQMAKKLKNKVKEKISRRAEEIKGGEIAAHLPLQRRMITKSGYMRKAPPQNKRLARWRRRYFTLSGRLLVYSRSRGSKGSKGIIDLAGAQVEAIVIPSGLRNRGEDVYEVRLAPRGTTRVYRFRPEKVHGSTKSLKREAKDWAASIRNNIRVANQEGDIRKKNISKMKEEMNELDKAKQKRLFRRQTTQTKQYSWESTRDFLKEENEQRSQNAFRQDNGAPSSIGQDLSIPEADEDILAYYDRLNVIPKATMTMIKKAYRALARDFHPDKNPEADKYKFAEIARAFEVLKDPDSRAKYDLQERVKQIMRQGIVVRKHDKYVDSASIVIFTDSRFLNLYWQDEQYGTVLHPGYKTIELRYITHVYAGSDGFHGFAPPPGKADHCLTIHGERMGYRDLHLELESKEARDEFLDGFRLLRCSTSELFKQRLDEMFDKGMR